MRLERSDRSVATQLAFMVRCKAPPAASPSAIDDCQASRSSAGGLPQLGGTLTSQGAVPIAYLTSSHAASELLSTGEPGTGTWHTGLRLLRLGM
jgi:hypothetical protein